MSGIQWFRAVRCAQFLLAVALLLLAASRPAAAVQDAFENETQCWWDPGGNTVCGDAYLSMTIFYSGSGTDITAEIITDVSTEIAYEYAWEGLYVYAESDLYLNDTLLGIAPNGEDGGFAEATDSYTNQPVGTQDFYQLVGTHIATFVGSCGEEGFGEGGGCGCNWDSSYQTYVGLAADMPYIGGLSQNYGTLDSSGSITASGANLVDPSTCTAQVNITGSGDSFSVPDAGCQENSATLNYTINLDASLGPQSLSLTTAAGTSNSVSFANDDPTPSIGSINPNTWYAGNLSFPVTITGTGFGTNPTISVSDTINGASCTVGSPPPSDSGGVGNAVINANCGVSRNDPSTSATVTVTSAGYGNGFAPAPTGATSTAYNVTIVPGTGSSLPTPQILYFGGSIPTTPVYVGQEIALAYATLNLPAGYQKTSDSWTIGGTWIGGYVASSTLGAQTLPLPTLTGPSVPGVTFYWISTGAGSPPTAPYNVTYQYCVNSSTTLCASTTATFTVAGPTATGANGTFFTATPAAGAVNVYAAGTANGGKSTNPWLEFGDYNPAGISFAVAASAPVVNDPNNPGIQNNASFQWVQLIGSETLQSITNPQISTPPTQGPLLDNWYPYVVQEDFPDSAVDSPGQELTAHDSNGAPIPMGELKEAFNATMYLMWDPALPSGCEPASTIQTTNQQTGQTTITSTPSKCAYSIPVPVGYVPWGFTCDAINTLQNQSNGTQWLKQCGGPSPATPTVQSSSSYPLWTNTFTNGTNNSQ